MCFWAEWVFLVPINIYPKYVVVETGRQQVREGTGHAVCEQRFNT